MHKNESNAMNFIHLKRLYVFGRPFVKRFALCYRTVVLSVCLSVTLVYCGQTVRRIKMKLGMQVGFGPGHIVLDGGPSSPSPKGHSPPIFGTYLLRPNGCIDQDVTWYGARPRPNFGPFLLWPNGGMHQDAIWYGCRPQPRGLCVRWRLSPAPQKGDGAPQIFGPCLLWPNGWIDQDATLHEGRPQPR